MATATTYTTIIGALLRPWWVRLIGVTAGIIGGVQAYDAISNQFNLPKLPVLMTGLAGLIPVWGWFMLLQYGLIFGLLDYLRRVRTMLPQGPSVADPRLDGLIERQKAIIDDYQRISAIEARVEGELDGVKAGVQQETQYRTMAIQVLERELAGLVPLMKKAEQIRVDTAIVTRDLEKLDSVVEMNAERVRQSFGALHMREQIQNHEAAMIETASELYDRLDAGVIYTTDDWERWGGFMAYWEANLKRWLNIAKWYAPNVEDRVMAIDERLYAGPWTVRDDQIPTAEGTRQFRRFRILQRQWEEVRDDVKVGLEQVAFVGLSERDVQTRAVSPF